MFQWGKHLWNIQKAMGYIYIKDTVPSRFWVFPWWFPILLVEFVTFIFGPSWIHQRTAHQNQVLKSCCCSSSHCCSKLLLAIEQLGSKKCFDTDLQMVALCRVHWFQTDLVCLGGEQFANCEVLTQKHARRMEVVRHKNGLWYCVFPTEWRIHKGFDDSSSFYGIWGSANQPINPKVSQEVAFLNSEDRGHLVVWRWIALKPSTVYPFLNLRPHCNEHSLRRLQTLNNGWNDFGFLPVSIPILRLHMAVSVNVHLQHRRCIE